MSYLNAPRLNFFGRFLADPSTLNNDACNYNPAAKKLEPAWNPDGSHAFKITGCSITGLTMPDGSAGTGDPLLGTPVASIDTPNPAKLVDLDTEQQMVSMIFGMRLQVGGTASSFSAAFDPVCFNDIFARVIGGQPDSMFSAYYQSVLSDVQWNDNGGSPFISALRAASPNALSIKFVVDGFEDDSSSPNFTYGRVVGTIGPATAGEPPNFVVGRLLRPNTNAATPFNYGWAVVNPVSQTVTIDLGNSLASTSAGGPPPDLGTLTAVVFPAGTSFLPSNPVTPVQLGSIDYSLTAYQKAAWIQQFPTTPAVIAQLQNGAELAVVQSSGGGVSTIVLQENQTCGYVCATPFVFRMNPGDNASVQLMAVQNGLPSSGQVIAVSANNGGLQPANCRGANLSVGTPASALSYPASVTTGPDGIASLSLAAGNPGNPRTYIGGQIYGVGFTSAALDPAPDPNWFLSVNIYSSTSIPDNPTWIQDVLAILQPYAKLYPYMDQIIQLNDYAAVVAAAPQIGRLLSLPIESPSYMPVTRDMPSDQKKIILKWIANGTPQGSSQS